MDNNKDYYKILGINRNADQEEISKAYKKLCMKWHPDRWVSATEDERKNAEEKFKEVNEANSILSDEQKRQHYDLFGTTDGNGFNPFGGFGGFDPFSTFWQTEPRRTNMGSNIEITVDITLKEAFEGVKKTITYSRYKPCKECNGTGSINGKVESCPHCNGTGRYRNVQNFGGMTTISETDCPYCLGKGTIVKDKCPHCHGDGVVNGLETFEIVIPQGIINGTTICVTKEGNFPRNGGIVGDLHVTINIRNDEKFWRHGTDLCTKLDITLLEAWCGCNKTVKHIDGTELTVVIKPLTPDGEKYIIPKRGFKNNIMSNDPSSGNFVIFVNYIVPKSITEEQKKLLEEFYNLEKIK